jgi:hypothetical protein
MHNAKMAKVTPPIAINSSGIAQYQRTQNNPALSSPFRPRR